MQGHNKNEAAMRQLWEAYSEGHAVVACGICGLPLKQSAAGAAVPLDCATGCAASRGAALRESSPN